jgi:hypothetical protein
MFRHLESITTQSYSMDGFLFRNIPRYIIQSFIDCVAIRCSILLEIQDESSSLKSSKTSHYYLIFNESQKSESRECQTVTVAILKLSVDD